jgi:hypothetical protein
VTARFGEALVITVHTGTVIITAALSFGRRGDVCLAVIAISAGSEVVLFFIGHLSGESRFLSVVGYPPHAMRPRDGRFGPAADRVRRERPPTRWPCKLGPIPGLPAAGADGEFPVQGGHLG